MSRIPYINNIAMPILSNRTSCDLYPSSCKMAGIYEQSICKNACQSLYTNKDINAHQRKENEDIKEIQQQTQQKWNEAHHEKRCLCHRRTTKAQISLPRSLISAFVVRCLDSIFLLGSISKLSSLYLASVSAQAGLSLPWSQTPKTGFLVTRLKIDR